MAIEKKQLIGGINTDDSERLLELSDYVNMENLRIGGSATGRDGRIENIPGTLLVGTNPFTGVNTTIGKCKDENKGRFFFFNHNPSAYFKWVGLFPLAVHKFVANQSHNILCYDQPSGQLYIVMTNEVAGIGLNFDLDHPIDCYFVNGCLYWTDGLNEPRMINVERALKTFQLDYNTDLTPYVFPINQVNLCWVKKPPILPPTFVKQTVDVNGTGTGTGYAVTAKWYYLFFTAGPSHGAIFTGIILKVTTPTGDTYYGGPIHHLSNGTNHTFSLYDTSGDNPPGPTDQALLPTSVNFLTLPAATAFGTIAEMMNYYSNPPNKPSYPATIIYLQLITNPVTITHFPVPNFLAANNFIRFDAFQFCWFFDYWNNERSVESKLSKTANYNFETDLFDTIRVTMPIDEAIEQDVRKVNLAVRFVANSEDNYFIIKTWENDLALDGAAIQDHNSQTKALEYLFDNSSLGIALDAAYNAKKFDLVPLISKTVAPAKDRFYHGNYTIGYDAPSYTTLSATVQKATDGLLVGQWIYIYINGGADKKYFIKSSAGYFTSTYPDSHVLPPYPSTLAIAGLTKVANDAGSFSQYLFGNPLYPGWAGNIQYPDSADVTITGATNSLVNQKVLKTDASYKLSIHFTDFAGRECGAVTNDTLLLHSKDRDYVETTFATGINWSLINDAAQIPKYATHYSINKTKCLRTRYFISMRSFGASYVLRDANGKNTYSHSGYAYGMIGVAFDITVLLANGMGYTFTDGDLVNIWDTTNKKYTLRITGQEGNWLITELQNLGTFVIDLVVPSNQFKFLFEIFTPHKRSETEPFFEEAQVFKILNPGTDNRAFSVSAGTFDGDVSLLQRTDGAADYLVEAMSPNDHYWTSWNTDAGKSIGFDKIGQVTLEEGIAFSDKFIPETKVNGLSSFGALNNDNLYKESGPLTKLMLASKQQEDGSVMLGICQKGTVSIYLGETQMVSNSGDAFIAQSVGVIGTKNLLKGNFGCLFHTCVCEYLGEVYFLDLYNGAFVRYSENGLFPVSTFKARRFFSVYSRRYMQQGTAGIKTRNGYFHPKVAIDPFNGEVMISLPATEDAGYCGTLPGFDQTPTYTPSLDNRYDFYDGKAKTVSYKFKANLNRWAGSHGWVAEAIDFLGMDFYSWKAGSIYKHEADLVNTNTFHGVQYPGRICFTSNVGPSDVRLPLTLSVEGSDKPTFTHLYTDKPYKQSTDLAGSDFEKKEGIYYAPFKNNRLSLNTPTGTTANQNRRIGQRIRTATPFVMLEFAIFDRLINIDFINIGYRKSAGHKV